MSLFFLGATDLGISFALLPERKLEIPNQTDNRFNLIIAGVIIVKKTAVLIALILVLVVFPLLNAGAFADFIGSGALPMNMLSEPVNMILFGAGLMVFGSSLRRI